MLNLESLLARHEGVRRFAYDDATGKPVRDDCPGKITVGVRRNLTDIGFSADEIGYLTPGSVFSGRST